MNNCKRCGALVGADYIFCGKCGEPVNRTVSEERIVKAKKLKKLYFLEKKLSRSAVFTGAFTGVWAAVSAVWVLFLLASLRGVKAGFSSIGVLWSQLLYKYEYVKEGLSLSYISSEISSFVNYITDWAFLILNIILIAVCVILFGVYLSKFISLIKKKMPGRKADVLRRITAKTGLISIAAYILIVIISYILKGIV